MDKDGKEGGEDSGSGFQYVARKSKANRKRRKGKREEHDDHENKLAKRMNYIDAQKAFLSIGAVGTSIQALLDDTFPSANEDDWPTSILTLGLGSIKDSKAAQTQLAFLLLVRDKLQRRCPQYTKEPQNIKIEAYDPIFDTEDQQILAAYDIEISDTNVQGKYTLDHAVFVYMPHCTKTLYENILRCNWSPTGLNRLWLCCNELERYADDSRGSKSSTPCIKRIVNRLSLYRLPSLPSSYSGAFNDMAMQRYCAPPLDPVDKLTDELSKSTIQSDGRYQAKDDSSFFDLPEVAVTDKDPELL